MDGNAVPFVTPYGVSPMDVPWLADLIARRAVRLFDPRQLHDLKLTASLGPNCALHTARLQLPAQESTTTTANSGDNNIRLPNGNDTTTAATGGDGSSVLVALKQYHRPTDLMQEVHQLVVMRQPSQYLNPLLGIVQLGDQGLTCLVVPYHPLGNLRRYIADQRANLNALQQLQIIHDIASGLEVLHQNGARHLNLHSANVLISLQGIAVLAEWGRANNRAEVGMPPKPTAEQERIRSLAAVFMAPEVLVSNTHSTRSEIYALGMIMFELLTGRVAFERDLSQPGLSNRIMFGRQDQVPSNVRGSPGRGYEALITDCWKLNPGERPHLAELKSRLEQLMMDCRQQSEAFKLQQQVTQLQQQQLYQQQQQAQYMQSYQPGTIAPPTPPLPETPTVDPMLQSQSITARYAANNAAQAAKTTPVPNIITTQVIMSDTARPRAESSAHPATPGAEDASGQQKRAEAWTIGLATAPANTQQRDAIPIPTRSLEMTSGHLRSKSASPTEQHVFTTALPLTPTTPSISTAGSDSGHNSSTMPAWPMPPKMNTLPQATSFSLAATTTAAATSSINTGPGVHIPPKKASGFSSFPMPPPARTNSNNSDPDFVSRVYAVAPPATPPASTFDSRPVPIAAINPVAPVSKSSTQAANVSPTSPMSPSMTMSPSALFNPGKNAIIATAAAEHQEPIPTSFSWRQTPRIPDADADDEEIRKINSVSSSRVMEDGYTSSDTDRSASRSFDSRQDKIRNFVTPVDTGAGVRPLFDQQQTQPPLVSINSKQPRESILIIPAFPEPPSTLHNRRISNMDVRHHLTVRHELKSPLYIHGNTYSLSSDDAGSVGAKSPTRVTPGAIMTPQEAVSGAPPTSAGLAARGSYTPITSSEDVPTGTPSKCIYSAARNGDLLELQQFLNKAMGRSLSNGSSSSMSMGSGSRTSSRRAASSVSEILDEVEPIERLPVLCCAAVARKNKYQALNMVFRAGANMDSREQRGGNTPLHLVCETAPAPVEEPSVVRYKQDGNGSRIQAESVVDLTDPRMSQLSLLEVAAGERFDDDEIDGDGEDEDSEEKQAAALKKVDDQDEQEQQALERVKEDSESVFSISINDDGLQSLSTRQQSSLGGAYYQMKNYILMKGGLEDQIRLLALAGSTLDTPNYRGETPLLLLLRFHDSVTALATLLRLGADPTLMAPFGPGTNPPEIHIDPKSIPMTKEQKRASKNVLATQKIFLPRSASGYLDSFHIEDQPTEHQHAVAANQHPNHILIMHGSALAHAAYYLRVNCIRYLLEHEIEASDPAIVEQAIVACRQSVAAKVNPQLVATQNRILQILERDWSGESGRRRRGRVAERTLNRKSKPARPKVLLVALAVSSSASSTTSLLRWENNQLISPSTSSTNISTPTISSTSTGRMRTSRHGRVSAVLSGIPTTHLFAVEGPAGPEIELISQHGFHVDTSVPRFQLTDRAMPMTPSTNSTNGGSATDSTAADYAYSTVALKWRAPNEPTSPRAGQGSGGDAKGILKKIRNIGKR